MKTLTILLLLTISAFAGPDVAIIDLSHVTIDGKSVGTVVDVLANTHNDAARAPLLDALIAREKALVDKIAALTAQSAASVAQAETIAKSDKDDGEKVDALMELLTEIKRPEKEKKKAEIQSRIDADQAELDALK